MQNMSTPNCIVCCGSKSVSCVCTFVPLSKSHAHFAAWNMCAQNVVCWMQKLISHTSIRIDRNLLLLLSCIDALWFFVSFSAGSFANTTGLSQCFDCVPGAYQSSNGLTQCDLCGVGTYTSTPAQSVCSACARLSFSQTHTRAL